MSKSKPEIDTKKKTSTTSAAPASKPKPEPEVDHDAAETGASGWDAVETAVEDAEKGGLFIKLEDDGESFTGAIVGEPLVRKVVFENSPFKKKGQEDKPQTRIGVNVALFDPKTKEIVGMKIYEAGPKFFKGLLTVKEKFPLDKWALTVTRNGKKGSNKTTYVILPDHELSPAEKDTIGALDLNDLEPSSFDADKLDAEAAQ